MMKSWLQTRLIPKLAAALIRLLGASIRLQVRDDYGLIPQANRSPVLFAFWHNRLFLLPYIHNLLIPNHVLAVMISRSRDGTVITDIIREFGMYAARGSSSKRGSAALLNLVHCIEKDRMDVAITPDGPRGPRQQLQPGILHLSRKTGCPIIPLTVEFSSKIEMKSWDRFQIPLPFSRCEFAFGAPITVPAEATDEDLLAIGKTVSLAMGS